MLLAVSSEPHDGGTLAIGWQWLLLGMCLPLAGLGAFGMRLKGTWSAVLLAFAAGPVVRLRRGLRPLPRPPDPAWRVLLEPTIWAIVVNGILGTVLFALALQRGKVTVVAAVSFTTNTVLPAAIGILFLGDQVRSGYAAVATAGFLIAVSGAIALAQFSGPMPADTAQPARARA